jgi:hypothetical protein
MVRLFEIHTRATVCLGLSAQSRQRRFARAFIVCKGQIRMFRNDMTEIIQALICRR